MLQTRENLIKLTDLTLAKNKAWSIEGDRRGDVITCLNGILWITQAGDLKDYVFESGRTFWVTRPGMVVVQALDSSQFRYSLNELPNHMEIVQQPINHSSQAPHVLRNRVNHYLR
jgi:hypothetical protein